MTSLFEPVAFVRGPSMPNRFMLAPLTNTQSHPDGRLSDEEHRWLTMRAHGGFGLVMTCATSVNREGIGFPGQLSAAGDEHLPGLTRLASDLRAAGAVSSVQLHHAGNRSPQEVTGLQPVCPSEDAETGARAMSVDEVEAVIEDFVAAAVRCDRAGFDGVELHGAHGYLICQFLSPELNRRSDRYGGTLENRGRVLTEIIAGIRARCRADFQLGVRLSPERFGVVLDEIVEVFGWLVASGDVDYVDMSLWDVNKTAGARGESDRRLIEIFAGLPRGNARLTVAGKITGAADVRRAIDDGADVVAIGRGAILHHDFPGRVSANPEFTSRPLPVSPADLAAEGLSVRFVDYMRNWPGFVSDT